jgi:hypothetical protein
MLLIEAKIKQLFTTSQVSICGVLAAKDYKGTSNKNPKSIIKMIYSRRDLLNMIYETEEQQEIMFKRFLYWNDYEFLQFAKQYFPGLNSLGYNRFTI